MVVLEDISNIFSFTTKIDAKGKETKLNLRIKIMTFFSGKNFKIDAIYLAKALSNAIHNKKDLIRI